MNRSLSIAFSEQVSSVELEITSVREALAAETDPEGACILREKINTLEKFIDVIKAAEMSLYAAEGEASEQDKKFAEWRTLVLQIRERIPEFDKTAVQLPSATEQVNAARAMVQNCRDELAIHKSHPPGALALEKERVKFTKETARLESLVASLAQELHDAVAKEDSLRADAMRQRDELGRLSWRENNLRPPSLQRRSDGSGAFRVVA